MLLCWVYAICSCCFAYAVKWKRGNEEHRTTVKTISQQYDILKKIPMAFFAAVFTCHFGKAVSLLHYSIKNSSGQVLCKI